jgi:hypothetical protein
MTTLSALPKPIKFASFVIGLPGSGKSWYIENVLNAQGAFDLVIDDPKDIQRINQGISEHKHMIIADPWLCDPKIREKALAKFNEAGIYVFQHYFENDPEKCMKNIAYRNDGRIVTNLSVFNYVIPEYHQVIPIWTPSIKTRLQ